MANHAEMATNGTRNMVWLIYMCWICFFHVTRVNRPRRSRIRCQIAFIINIHIATSSKPPKNTLNRWFSPTWCISKFTFSLPDSCTSRFSMLNRYREIRVIAKHMWFGVFTFRFLYVYFPPIDFHSDRVSPQYPPIVFYNTLHLHA